MRRSIGLLPLLLGPLALARPDPAAYNSRRQNPDGEYEVKTPPLTTPWTDKVGTNPWPEYPRPQLQRPDWQNLNGVWTYQKAQSLEEGNTPPSRGNMTQEVLVPSCLESGLSGVQGEDVAYSWFATVFTVPGEWAEQSVLLNFAAVDYEATVFVNGQNAGFHRGGYFAFTIDVTDYVSRDGDNELFVFVYDPTDSGDVVIPIGKQTLNPAHIFYTPCSGIWQTVWIESAPSNYVTRLDVAGDMDGQVTTTVNSASGEGSPVEITVYDVDSGDVVTSHEGTSDEEIQFNVDSPKLWSPDSPSLYDITVTMGDDEIQSYTGFRTISKATVGNIERPVLNGEFLFQFGTLDQGYWPDGIYTPPNREAMTYDLEVLKRLGFNMVRKHVKIETPLFYRACDELGLLVIQDMPSLRPRLNFNTAECPSARAQPSADQQTEFGRQLDLLVNQFKSYPSITTWVIFNEGWGQVGDEEFEYTTRVRELDPSRLVDAASGWNDHGAGDFSDNHHYANPQCGSPFWSLSSGPYDAQRIGLQGEFGGIGHNVSIDHLWNVPQAIQTINETYELNESLDSWNYRGRLLLQQLRDQVEMYACSGGVWTQTTDVEGEVNGLLTYDRRVLRTDETQWQEDIQNLYSAASQRRR